MSIFDWFRQVTKKEEPYVFDNYKHIQWTHKTGDGYGIISGEEAFRNYDTYEAVNLPLRATILDHLTGKYTAIVYFREPTTTGKTRFGDIHQLFSNLNAAKNWATEKALEISKKLEDYDYEKKKDT